MNDPCVWKQLIKILLPVLLIFGVLPALGWSAEASEVSMDLVGQRSGDAGKKDPYTSEGRSQKVRTKWRGDKFWAEAMANLTGSELDKEKLAQRNLKTNYTTEGRMQTPMPAMPMAYQAMPRKRSTLHREKQANATTTIKPIVKIQPPKSSTSATSNKKSQRTQTSKSSRTKKKSPGSRTQKPKVSKGKTPKVKASDPKTPKPQAFSKFTAAPKAPLDRTTLVADLSPFQEYYLEYQSDEVDETSTVKTQRPRPPLSRNGTQGLNSTQFQIDFFPKTPVNLLYLLQAYASNMKPIQVQSPIASGIQTAIPVSMPVRVNPPKSPFLFTLDLDNSMTRVAISLFYSSIAMAPLIYMMFAGLGSLSGLTIVPFTGRKRRRRRRRRDVVIENNDSLIEVSRDLQDLEILTPQGPQGRLKDFQRLRSQIKF